MHLGPETHSQPYTFSPASLDTAAGRGQTACQQLFTSASYTIVKLRTMAVLKLNGLLASRAELEHTSSKLNGAVGGMSKVFTEYDGWFDNTPT